MVVLVVILEVFGQVADTLCEDRDLYFRTARVVVVAGVILDNLLFCFGGNRHNISLLLSDIGKVEAPHNLGCACDAFHQRYRGFTQFRQIEPIAVGHPGKDPALTDRLRAIRIEFQGRDVVQPCLERQE